MRGLAPEAVLVFEEPGDALTHPPVEALESWVESGGRLVISSVLLDSYPALEGVERHQAHATHRPCPRRQRPPAQRPGAAPPPQCAPRRIQRRNRGPTARS